MGEVYRARDTRLDRTVAIKVLPESLVGDEGRRQRLEREARTISTISHPHVCALYDVGRHGATDYLVMEYLEGQTLAERLAKGPLRLVEALELAIQMAGGLAEAHRRGIVHRDLKPANIMVSGTGHAKILDFGLARRVSQAHERAPASDSLPTVSVDLSRKGAVVGTVAYMSPEQARGEEVDSRSDVFSFGVMLYELLAGRVPFKGTARRPRSRRSSRASRSLSKASGRTCRAAWRASSAVACRRSPRRATTIRATSSWS